VKGKIKARLKLLQ